MTSTLGSRPLLKQRGIYLTWNDSRRSESLARLLALPRHCVPAPSRGVARHVLATVRTVRLLIRLRPQLVWYQFSWALGVALWAYALLKRSGSVRLVADVHTKALRRRAIFPFSWPVLALKRRALQRCAAVLVSNERDQAHARQRFGLATLVLPDPLPAVPARSATAAPPAAVFVCSFAVDEPLELMIAAVERLRGRVPIAITGDSSAAPRRHREALRRTDVLTGFLPEWHYWELLRAARAVIVLSTEPGCLPCGAYEAMAAGKRPIVADDALARATFGDGARYVTLDPVRLEEAVLQAIQEEPHPCSGAGYNERWSLLWTGVEAALRAVAALPRA